MYSEVQAELRERKGIDIPMTHVIMTSDETDETWWDEVRAIGWVKMDHDKLGTVERYGKWCVSCFCRAHIHICVVEVLCVLSAPSPVVLMRCLCDGNVMTAS